MLCPAVYSDRKRIVSRVNTLMAAVSLEALGAHLRSIREHADAHRAAAPSVVRQSKCEQAAAHRHPHG